MLGSDWQIQAEGCVRKGERHLSGKFQYLTDINRLALVQYRARIT